jgi:hypothetical protein
VRGSCAIWRAAVALPGGATAEGKGASRRDAFQGALRALPDAPPDAKAAARRAFETLRGARVGARTVRAEWRGASVSLRMDCR